MKNQEAKFILGAYRPDGRDAGDVTFEPALEQAERDPELRAWFATERKFDAALALKLQSISPPPELRDAILAGARMAGPPAKRGWWTQPRWFAVAAAIALTAIVTQTVLTSSPRPGGAELAALALRDLSDAHDEHLGKPAELAEVQAQLARTALPLTSNLRLDRSELKRSNCRELTIGDRKVFEVCFERDGTWYHVYVGRRSDFAPGTFDPKALLTARGDYSSTVWADASNVYALVAQASAQALRRVI